jgi:hypothetical protein
MHIEPMARMQKKDGRLTLRSTVSDTAQTKRAVDRVLHLVQAHLSELGKVVAGLDAPYPPYVM